MEVTLAPKLPSKRKHINNIPILQLQLSLSASSPPSASFPSTHRISCITMMNPLPIKNKTHTLDIPPSLPRIRLHDSPQRRLPIYFEPDRKAVISSSYLDAHDVTCKAISDGMFRLAGCRSSTAVCLTVDVVGDVEAVAVPCQRFFRLRTVGADMGGYTYTAAETRLLNCEILLLPMLAGNDTEHSTKSSPSGT